MRILYNMVGGRILRGRAKFIDSVVNQTNTMGGVKKQGLPSTVGLPSSVAGVYRKEVGCLCPSAYDMMNTTKTCSTIGGYRPRTRC